MSKTHKFRIEVANVVGVNAAIILENLDFWIEHNRANNINYQDGRYWTFNSIRAFCEIFPYLTKSSISTAINKLIDGGYVATGNYNQMNRDQTKWYTITSKGYELLGDEDIDEQHFEASSGKSHFRKTENPFPKNSQSISDFQQMDLSEIGNGFTENRKPLPDNKPNNKQQLKNADSYYPPIPPTPEPTEELPPFNGELLNAVMDWFEYKKEKRQTYTRKGKTILINQIKKYAGKYGDAAVARVIQDSMASNYSGITFDRLDKSGYGAANRQPTFAELIKDGAFDDDTQRSCWDYDYT